jgi:hypothetical protein
MDERKLAVLCALLAVGLAVTSCERSASEPRSAAMNSAERAAGPARPHGGPVLRPPPARLIEVAVRK